VPVETKEIFKTMKHVKDIPKLKETLIITKDDEEVNMKHANPKEELIINKNDTLEKEVAKLTDKNTKLTPKTRKKIDITNDTSVLSVK